MLVKYLLILDQTTYINQYMYSLPKISKKKKINNKNK